VKEMTSETVVTQEKAGVTVTLYVWARNSHHGGKGKRGGTYRGTLLLGAGGLEHLTELLGAGDGGTGLKWVPGQ